MNTREFWNAVGTKFEGAPVRLTPRCHPKANVECYMLPQQKRIFLCCSVCERPILITTLDENQRMETGL